MPQQTRTFRSTTGKNAVRNAILLSLPRKESAAVFKKLEHLELPVRTVLNEVRKPIEHAYFINSGLASVLTVLPSGRSVEVGLGGKESFVGLPLIVGFSLSPTRVIMQIGGTGFRINANDLKALLDQYPHLKDKLNQYNQEMALQGTQVAACNRLHRVEKRMARWLLMTEDRVGESTFILTQEFLSHMLGSRRASVTEAAGTLQKAGLITYTRGQIRIHNRAKLENASCECYFQITDQIKAWHEQDLKP